LDAAIREQFGYEDLLWVYSGRRGIHLWISDKEAMELTDDQRKAVVDWMTVVQSGKESGKKLNVHFGSRSLPPPLQMGVDILKEVFSDLILSDQNLFASQEGYELLLEQIPDLHTVSELRAKWVGEPGRSSEAKWQDFKKEVEAYEKGSSQRVCRFCNLFYNLMNVPQNNLLAAMEDIILFYTYPRIDAEVSKHRNHLLKAPFCIHPKTGRVCVPVDPTHIDDFDPETVPTVGQLLQELDAVGRSEGEPEEHHSDWEKTSLKPYVDIMDKHVLRLMER
ncbi:hypothetical protein H0H87_010298, partial [Tephrocybe sp. NHM501043]